MPNIDERVVQMTFDNRQFEAGVSESLKTLDDLKKALNFDEVEGSLKNIENAFNNLNLSGLADSVDFIASRFEPLGKIADVALSRIADKALDAGKKIADAFLGFSDFSAGQGKYETQTKAVQTITNATGKSVDEVEKVLAKLQKYTDETSYDFAEMVSSIGKFTSVGVELERAEKAMEGIASEAAKSGAGKAEANRAMYNFAQALSAGYVKLIDWKSIENANMATKEFKETLIETAIEEGVLERKGNGVGTMLKQTSKGTKEVNVDFKSFNETLSEEWLTSDVLIKTLEKYADTTTDFGLAAYHAAQEALTWTDAIDAVHDAVSSGWMQSLKYIFGDLDEARQMWTNVANALVEYTDIFTSWRNEVLKGWHDAGGYNDMIEAASNLWQTFMNIVKGVGQALANVFPILAPENMTQALLDGTKALKDWSAGLLEMFGLQEEIQEEEEKTADTVKEIKNEVDSTNDSVSSLNKTMDGLSDTTKNVASSVGNVETGLKRGMRGEKVKALQKYLISLGYNLDKFGADGIYGPETQAAVKALQKDLGLIEDGIFDEATKDEAAFVGDQWLKNLNKGLRRGAKGKQVKELQKLLNEYLGDSEKLAVDGIFGPKTEAAVKKMQKELKIGQTGVWSQNDIDALNAKKLKKTSKILLMDIKQMSKELKNGMKGEDVKKLQEELVKGGYLDRSMANGIYGPETKEAVKKLQKALGIKETGEWDKLTWISLHNSQQMTRNADATARANKKTSESAKQAASDNKKAADESRKSVGKTTLEMKKLQAITRGLTSGIKIITKFSGSIVQIAKNIAGFFTPIIKDIRDFVYAISGMIENLSKDLDENDVYKKFVDNVTNAFEPLRVFLNSVHTALHNFLMGYENFLKSINRKNPAKYNTFSNFLRYIKENYPILDGIINVLKTVGRVIGNVVGFISGILSSFFGMLSSEEFQNAKNSVFSWIGDKITKLGEAIANFKENHPEITIENFLNKIKEIGGWLGGKFGEGIEIVKTKFVEFKAVIDKFKEDHPELTISNIFQKIKDVFKSIGDVFSEFFAGGQQGEGGSFFDGLKERFKAFEPVLDWVEGIKDRIVKLWQSIFGGGEETTTATKTTKSTKPSDSPMINTMEVVEEKLSLFDRVVDWFIGVKDKLVAAWNDLLGINKGEDLEVPKAGGFVSVADKLKDFGKWILDNWPAISLAVIGVGASYALISAIQIARNLGKGFKDLGGAIKGLFGKEDPKDTLGNTALKIGGAIMIVALAVGLLSKIDADAAAKGFEQFIKVLGSMVAAVILIKEAGGESDGAKQALMLAASVGIIAAAIWLLCKTITGYNPGVIVAAIAIIAAAVWGLGKIAIELAKNSKHGETSTKGFLAMCAGVLVLVIAFGKLLKIINKYWNNGLQIAVAVAIIGGMVWGLGKIAIELSKNSTHGETSIKGFLSMCTGIYILVRAFGRMMAILDKYWNNGLQIAVAVAIIGGMVWGLGKIAIELSKNSVMGEVKLKGFLSLCGGVYLLVLAFERTLNAISGHSFWEVVGALAIVEIMIFTLSKLSEKMKGNSVGNGIGNLLTFISLAGVIWILAQVFEKIVNIMAQNNKGVVWGALAAIEVLLITIGVIAVKMSEAGGGKSLAGGIGNAITFISLAYLMRTIVSTIGDVLVKIKDVDPKILKWFFIGVDGAIAIMATTVAVLGKLFASNPIGLIIGEAGLLALFGVLAAGIAILAKVADSALQRFAKTLKYLGWGMESFDNSTGNINLERLKKVGEFLKDNLPAMVKSVLGINTNGLKDKMTTIKDMGTKVQLFAVAVSKVDQKALDGADKSKKLMEKADEIADTLEEASIPDLGKMGSLYMFGTGLYAYGYALSQMKAGDEATIGNVVSQTNQLLGIITDKGKLDQATSSIQALGGALEIYFEALDTRKVDENGQAVENTPINVQTMAQKMRELVGAFTDEEITKLIGYSQGKQQDMSLVANGISQLSLAFGSYADNIGKLKQDDINRANGVIDRVQGMTYDHTKIDGFYTSFSGINVPGAYIVALEIFGLGLALSSYAENIGKLKPQKVETANKVLDEIIKIYELKQKLTSPANVLDFLWKAFHSDSDEFNIEQFSTDIAAVGNALEVYAGGISGLALGKVFLANSVLRSLMDVASGLQQENWWTQLLLGNKSFGDFASNVGDLGGGLRDFGKAISEATFDTSKIETVFKEGGVIDQILSLLSKTSLEDLYITDFNTNQTVFKSGPIATAIKTFFDNLALAFSQEETNNSAVESLGSAGQTIVDSIANGVTNSNISGLQTSIFSAIDTSAFYASLSMVTTMNTLGTDLLSWIETGLKDETAIGGITGTMESLIGKIKTVLTSNWEAFKAMGQFIDLGIAAGLGESQSLVTKKAEEVAWAAYLAACKKLGIKSPSREFMYVGEMMDEGLAKGISSHSYSITDVGQKTLDEYRAVWGDAVLDWDEVVKPPEPPKKNFWSGIVDWGKNAAKDIDGFMSGISRSFTRSAFNISADLGIISSNVTDKINNELNNDANTKVDSSGFGQNVLDGIAGGITKANAEELPSAINDAIQNGISGLTSGDVPGMTEVGEKMIASVENGMKDETSSSAITTAIDQLLGGIKTAFTNSWESFKGIGKFINLGISIGLSESASTVTAKAEEVAWAAYLAACKKLGIKSPSREFMYVGEMMDEGLAKGLNDNVWSIEDAGSGIEEKLKEIWGDLYVDPTTFTTIGDGMANAAKANESAIGQFVENAGSTISDGFEKIKTVAGTTAEVFKNNNFFDIMLGGLDSQKIVDAYARQSGAIENAVETVTSNAAEAGSKASSNSLADAGKNILGNLAAGLMDPSKRGTIISGMNTLMTLVSNATKNDNNQEQFRSVGKYMDTGMELGLKAGSNNVTLMAARVAWDAYVAAKNVLGIASPSKEFLWLGEMVDKGLVLGLKTYAHSVSTAAGEVADGAIDTATKGVMALSDVIGFGDIDQPVIRPVLDLSDVQAGIKTMPAMFGKTTIAPTRSADMAGFIATRRKAAQDSVTTKADENSVREISEAIKKMTEDMNGVTDEIKNMKIYMDGNTLVGYVSPRVNKNLGLKATLAGRMN